MSNNGEDNESAASKIFKTLLVGAAVGVGAYIGYELYKTLTEEEVEKIPISYANTSDKNDKCAICLEMFEYNDNLKKLPECSHKYHAKCILEWIKTNPSCPLCRRSC